MRELYLPRVVDEEIDYMLSIFGAVYISGCKWCGKTWTGIAHSKSSLFLGDPKNRALADADLDLALEGEEPRLVDEWQDVPDTWDLARHNIDILNRRGMYIFTGSVTPPAGSKRHSGTGRFAPVKMRPMSLFESKDSSGSVSLSRLFDKERPPRSISNSGYVEIVNLICRGGWPAGLCLDDLKAISIPSKYVDMIANYDFTETDGIRRNPKTVKRILRSLARNNATEARISVLANDLTDDSVPMSPITAKSYLDALSRLFIIEEQYAWLPEVRSKTRMRTAPKRHFVDPSLAIAALKMSRETLINDVETVGLLFESLCYRDLCIYSERFGGSVYYYRDENGLEVDAIIEGMGKWAAVEVKVGHSKVDEAATNLLRLREKMVAGGVLEPAFLMVICATTQISYVRKDGVYVVPIDCLGP
jgi:Predicted ATPase (AAA+ superfamily)